MNFNFFMPTKIISGTDCVLLNDDEFKAGTSALIITGKNSARLCGALNDVTSVLYRNQINYSIFDAISENPLITDCYDAGCAARQINADFIIGIGGGSPLDAAKAAAAFAANEQIGRDCLNDLFENEKLTSPCLPLILIPTTAGTGSEVNYYSVLTLEDGLQKKTFKNLQSYPKTAFLDAKYTLTLNDYYTISTALDALCHCIEAYLSPKSNEISQMHALYGARQLWQILKKLQDGEKITPQMRAGLLCASCAAGIAIGITGTGFPHPLGYNLSLQEGIPHGRACAVFEGDFLHYNEKAAPERCANLYNVMGDTAEYIKKTIPEMSGVELSLSDEKIEEYISLVAGAGNYSNSFYVINRDEMRQIYKSRLSS